MVNGVTIPEYLPNGSNVSPLTDSNLGHCTTRRFTDLRISRHHRVSPVYFERNFLVFLGALHFSISRSLSIFPRSTSRVLGSDCLAVDGREGPSLPYPRKAALARPRERLSLGSARITGTFDFTRTGTKRH